MADLKNDIEKYLHGELSPAERHALEKQALNDPFLADALEGSESVPPQDFSSDLKSLSNSLHERIYKPTKGIPLWIWPTRIAAGLLFLILSTYIVITFVGEKGKSTELALSKDQALPKQSVEKNNDSIVVPSSPIEKKLNLSEPKEAKPLPPVTSPIIEQQPISGVQSIAAGAGDVAKPTEAPAATPEALTLSDATDEKERVVQLSPRAGYFQPKDDGAESAKKKVSSRAAGVSIVKEEKNKDKAAGKVVQGLVTDAEDGTPLPGVNVVVKGSSQGTVTDAEGNYEIALSDSKADIVFSFIGLQSQEVAVADKNFVNVQMSPDASELSEVVVTGYSSPEEKEEETHPVLIWAEPSGGKKIFKKYLEESMHYPELALENKIEGKVTVQFTVETNGQLSEFRVLRSVGYGCDEEVIRLIKEGPKWAPNTRDDEPVKGKVKVRLRFALPD